MPDDVSLESLKPVLESILFVAGKPVELGLLSRITGHNAEVIGLVVDEIAGEWKGRGVRVQRSGTAVQMATAPESAPYVQSFLGVDEDSRLTHAPLVVLTIIAYKQPITRPAIERILGRSCNYSVDVLKTRDLITEVGRSNGPGRPYLYGTTFRFLEHFGLEKPEDLPPLPELELVATETEIGEEETGDAEAPDPPAEG
ncbi:MAG TPA: SMC-Scp complex subunit ScpB [Dehalococcoidia bacterium]|nr:SMC-Scp complex subunit ScpB [Dehalococcoidia bacterium]